MRYERQARQELGELTHHLYRAGLAIGSPPPGLLAELDQHAAAIRDILMFSAQRVGLIELAAYARGVQDAAAESGWALPSPDNATPVWDWVDLRLAAVCLLAETGTSEELDTILSSWH